MTSLHDATARAFIQGLSGLSNVLAKGAAHAQAEGRDLAELSEARLAPDMLPLRYQAQAACAHSLGALQACESGVFMPPKPFEATYAELQALVDSTREQIVALTPEAVNGVAGRDVAFRLGDRDLPFEAADFLLSFSLPNFYFHTTTAYGLLRAAGTQLGKKDYIGRPRIKVG